MDFRPLNDTDARQLISACVATPKTIASFSWIDAIPPSPASPTKSPTTRSSRRSNRCRATIERQTGLRPSAAPVRPGRRAPKTSSSRILQSKRGLMGLLDSETGKRRLLSVEIPVVERYNDGRDPAFKIKLVRSGQHPGAALFPQTGPQRIPAGNPARLELPDGAARDARADADETLSAFARRANTLPVAAGEPRTSSRWDPSRFTCVFAVQAAWRWLACYEIWHETGEWPLPEAK